MIQSFGLLVKPRLVGSLAADFLTWLVALAIWNKHFHVKFGAPKLSLWDICLLAVFFRCLSIGTGSKRALEVFTDEEIHELRYG